MANTRACSVGLLLLVSIGCGTNAPIAKTPEVKTQRADSKPQSKLDRVEITVAAAADLKFAFEALTTEFERLNPDKHVKTTFGSSGTFYSQLSNQAPFDLYLSADIDYPRKLIEQKLAIAESEFSYAYGHLVVWVRNDSPLDVEKRGIEVLTDESVHKIAIANPKTAPYGRAAEASLKSLDVYDRVKDRIVQGDNIAQTAQFIESGSADVGLIALSLAMAPTLHDKGRYWQVPETAHPPIEQAGVVLTWVKNREATEALRTFIVSEGGQAILAKYGFTSPKDAHHQR